MKIAVTSQNRREITEHAGRCRKFWIYEIEHNQIRDKTLLELPKEQAFHESSPQQAHPLDGVDVLISASMGQGMRHRLAARGIVAVLTAGKDPDEAVAAWLAGKLQAAPPGQGCHHGHGAHHH